MSSSVGYGYSYIDLEAQRRRARRAEVAKLRQQLGAVRSQAAGLRRSDRRAGGVADVAGARLDATSQELEAVAGALRAAIAAAGEEVDHALTEFWEVRVGAALQLDPATRRPVTTATEELARRPATLPATAVAARQAAIEWRTSSPRPTGCWPPRATAATPPTWNCSRSCWRNCALAAPSLPRSAVAAVHPGRLAGAPPPTTSASTSPARPGSAPAPASPGSARTPRRSARAGGAALQAGVVLNTCPLGRFSSETT